MKHDSTISNKKNKVLTGKPKMSSAESLMRMQHRYKTMNLFAIFRRGPNNERNNSKRITRQGKHAKEGNRYTAEKIEDQYHEIHCKQTNLIMINKYHLSELTLRQKCPDMEFLLVRIFLYSDCQIGR